MSRQNRVPTIKSGLPVEKLATPELPPYESPYIYEPHGIRDRVNGKWVSRSIAHIEYVTTRRHEQQLRVAQYGGIASASVEFALSAAFDNPPADWETAGNSFGDMYDQMAARIVTENVQPRIGDELWQGMPKRQAVIAQRAGQLVAAAA